jgi:hypothetical protein
MAAADSALDPDQMACARELLAPRERPERMWPVLGAAALLAASALVFAAAMIAAPPLTSQHTAQRHAAH